MFFSVSKISTNIFREREMGVGIEHNQGFLNLIGPLKNRKIIFEKKFKEAARPLDKQQFKSVAKKLEDIIKEIKDLSGEDFSKNSPRYALYPSSLLSKATNPIGGMTYEEFGQKLAYDCVVLEAGFPQELVDANYKKDYVLKLTGIEILNKNGEEQITLYSAWDFLLNLVYYKSSNIAGLCYLSKK